MTKIVFNDGKRVDFNHNHGAGGLFASKGGGTAGGGDVVTRISKYNRLTTELSEAMSPNQVRIVALEAVSLIPKSTKPHAGTLAENAKILKGSESMPEKLGKIQRSMIREVQGLLEYANSSGGTSQVLSQESRIAAHKKSLNYE